MVSLSIAANLDVWVPSEPPPDLVLKRAVNGRCELAIVDIMLEILVKTSEYIDRKCSCWPTELELRSA